jgi:hypothetical protein
LFGRSSFGLFPCKASSRSEVFWRAKFTEVIPTFKLPTSCWLQFSWEFIWCSWCRIWCCWLCTGKLMLNCTLSRVHVHTHTHTLGSLTHRISIFMVVCYGQSRKQIFEKFVNLNIWVISTSFFGLMLKS